ncbi:MAG TPA: type IV pilus modification protein PilV [Lysobacter sp.]
MPAHSASPGSGAPRQRGVGLIEVLIAVLILAIGLLGIAALQAVALRNSQSALERSQAVVRSYDILEAMRVNVAEARSGGYDMPMTCTSPAPGTRGSSAGRLAGNDLVAWISAIHAELGERGCGKIACKAVAAPGSQTTDCTVTVRWDDSRGSGGSDRHEVTTVVRI